MKKLTLKIKLVAATGILGLINLLAQPAFAQTETAISRKVKVKIFENINGQTTMRDTVLEISGNQAMPDPMEIRKHLTRFSPEDSERMEKLNRQLRENGRPVEINRFEKVIKEGENPQEIRMLISKTRPEGDLPTPDSLRKFMKVERVGIEKLRNPETFKIDRKALENLTDKNVFKMVTPAGDSLMVRHRIIIVEHELTEPEKAVLTNKAKAETAGSKIKDLDLEAVNLYPNPTTGKFKITFKAPKKGNTSVSLMDNLGREIYREELGEFKGTYEKEFNLEGQAKGTYFLQVIQDKQVYNKKVIVQ